MSFYFDPFLGCLSNIAAKWTRSGSAYVQR